MKSTIHEFIRCGKSLSKIKMILGSVLSIVATGASGQWFQQTSGTIAALSSIHCADSNVCMVVGASTSIRKTTDGGTNWNQQTSLGTTNKTFVKMYSKDTVVLGQVNGTFKRTLNGGTTWSNDIFGGNTNFAVNDVVFNSALNFTAIGGSLSNNTTGGHITTSSTNTGSTWPTFVNTSGEPAFFGIHAMNSTTFFACGGAASIYKTTDAGANWTAVRTGNVAITLYDIQFTSPLIGYSVGGNISTTDDSTLARVFKTTDGGATWNSLSANPGLLPYTIYACHFINDTVGYVVGARGKIQVTKDGGATWTTQISPVTTTLRKIYFPTNLTGYICGDGGVILKTSNGGFIAPLVLSVGNDQSVCPGFCATVSASASGGTIPYTYIWSPGGATTSSIVVCPSTNGTYTVTITDKNGVTSADSAGISIHVNPVVSFSGLDSAYCNMLSADSLFGSPAGGAFSGAGIPSGDSVFNALAAGAGTHIITYTYSTGAGCEVDTSMSTIVLPLIPPVQICLVTVDSAIANTSNIVTWVKPASANVDSFRISRLIGASFTPIATVPYSSDSKYVDASAGADPNINAHSYAISVIDTCGYETALSDTATTIWLNWKPVYTGPDWFTLNWTDYNGFPFTLYEVWRTTDGGTSWDSINVVSYFAPPTYTDKGAPLNSRYRIGVKRPSICPTGVDTVKYSWSNVSYDYTAVHEVSLNNLLQVYPNPSNGTFTMKLSGTEHEVKGIKIYSMLGAVVYESAETHKTSDIQISGISPGIYQLEVITDKGRANKKIVIE